MRVTRGRRRDYLFSLGGLRQACDITQPAVAAAMGVSQPRVAKVEAASLEETDPKLSTLVRYLAALGGELEIRARFGERSYRLAGPPQKLPPPVPVALTDEQRVAIAKELEEAFADD